MCGVFNENIYNEAKWLIESKIFCDLNEFADKIYIYLYINLRIKTVHRFMMYMNPKSMHRCVKIETEEQKCEQIYLIYEAKDKRMYINETNVNEMFTK